MEAAQLGNDILTCSYPRLRMFGFDPVVCTDVLVAVAQWRAKFLDKMGWSSLLDVLPPSIAAAAETPLEESCPAFVFVQRPDEALLHEVGKLHPKSISHVMMRVRQWRISLGMDL